MSLFSSIFQFGNTLYSLPLFTTSLQYLKKPRFIKLEKHCQAPKSGEFNSWLFKQLSQELDLIQRIIGSNVRSISARPMFLFGIQTDLLNIMIEQGRKMYLLDLLMPDKKEEIKLGLRTMLKMFQMQFKKLQKRSQQQMPHPWFPR